MTPLEKKISDLYEEPLSPGEAREAANRLVEFYKVLWEIDRCSQTKKKEQAEPARSAARNTRRRSRSA